MPRTIVVLAALLTGPILVTAPVRAHEEPTVVIVDTDMALDDARAIILLLSSPRVTVAGFVTSDGSAAPDAGARNLERLLAALGKRDVPVGVGRPLGMPPPAWREMSDALGWADLPPAAPPTDGPRAAVPLLHELLSQSREPVTYVCLGPLTNLADLLQAHPTAATRIATVLYSGLPPGEPAPGWNTDRDRPAAESVLRSGIPFRAIELPADRALRFDAALYRKIGAVDTAPARVITRLHPHEKVQTLLHSDHFVAWDETVALYLDTPALGTFQPLGARPALFRLATWDLPAARAAYLAVVSSPGPAPALAGRAPVVLKRFPTDPALFQGDVQALVPQIIAAYGLEEWQTTVLTNELHRHLGIYSIVGAKMGIRARELLSASLDELEVESAAGLEPPVSCLNDGLQTATGASLGRGTITVSTAGPPAAEAVFVKDQRRLRLRLKPEIRDRIRADVQRAVRQYGDLTPEYFREVRRLSVQYWAEMDRTQIFEARFE